MYFSIKLTVYCERNNPGPKEEGNTYDFGDERYIPFDSHLARVVLQSNHIKSVTWAVLAKKKIENNVCGEAARA